LCRGSEIETKGQIKKICYRLALGTDNGEVRREDFAKLSGGLSY
jgi:hypothetical protein